MGEWEWPEKEAGDTGQVIMIYGKAEAEES